MNYSINLQRIFWVRLLLSSSSRPSGDSDWLNRWGALAIEFSTRLTLLFRSPQELVRWPPLPPDSRIVGIGPTEPVFPPWASFLRMELGSRNERDMGRKRCIIEPRLVLVDDESCDSSRDVTNFSRSFKSAVFFEFRIELELCGRPLLLLRDPDPDSPNRRSAIWNENDAFVIAISEKCWNTLRKFLI